MAPSKAEIVTDWIWEKRTIIYILKKRMRPRGLQRKRTPQPSSHLLTHKAEKENKIFARVKLSMMWYWSETVNFEENNAMFSPANENQESFAHREVHMIVKRANATRGWETS
jgi:hypothetical protein